MARIIDQFGRKRCQKKRKDMEFKLLSEFFPKIFSCTRAVGYRKFVQYIRMLYTGRFILAESVAQISTSVQSLYLYVAVTMSESF